jgi:hypothetical protein
MAKKLEQELGIGALRQKWRAHIVLIDEPIRPHDNMKCIMLFFVKFKQVFICVDDQVVLMESYGGT